MNNKTSKDTWQLLHDAATPYQDLMCCLLYVSITCANLTFVVHRLTQFLAARTAMAFLRYLKSNHVQCIFYLATSVSMLLRMLIGQLVLIRDGPLHGFGYIWSPPWPVGNARKIKTISCNSTEAEYRSLDLVTCELIWLQQLLLRDLKIDEVNNTTKLFCDSKYASYESNFP